MNVYDILLGALLILIIALAVRKIYRDKKFFCRLQKSAPSIHSVAD